MPLTYFTVIANYTAVVRRPSQEDDPDPWLQRISGLVTFTPSVREVRSEEDATTYRIASMLGRITDGVLMTVRGLPLDGQPPGLPGEPPDHTRYGLRLTANTSALGPLPALDYRAVFTRVVYGRADQTLASFTFEAPRDDEVVDLSTVHQTSIANGRTPASAGAKSWL